MVLDGKLDNIMLVLVRPTGLRGNVPKTWVGDGKNDQEGKVVLLYLVL